MVKNPPINAEDIRDVSSIPGSGRSPGRGHGNPFQYSCPQVFYGLYGPWGHKESDTTEQLSHTYIS